MSYAVKETFLTLQGEGHHSGRTAVFLRFAGCNLWSGREADRAAATCSFCDTDFVGTDGPGGGRFSDAASLARHVRRIWDEGSGTSDEAAIIDAGATSMVAARHGAARSGPSHGNPADRNTTSAGDSGDRSAFVVCTGGEPLLQIDPPLIDALHAENIFIAAETNGTIEAPSGLDWICVSPKAGAELVQKRGDELKLVYRQAGAPPEAFERLDFDHFYLQPMDGPDVDRFTAEAIRYCLRHPRWRLSIQTHKLLGIP